MDKVEVFKNRQWILVIQKDDPEILQKTIKEYENHQLVEDEVLAILLNDELMYYKTYFEQLFDKYKNTPRNREPYDLTYTEAKYMHDNAIKYISKRHLIESGFMCLTPISMLRCINIIEHKAQFDLFWNEWKDKIDECIAIDMMWNSTRSSHRSYAYAESVVIMKLLLNRIYEENLTSSKFYGVKLNYEDSYLDKIKRTLVVDPINEMLKVSPRYERIDIPEDIVINSLLVHHRNLIYKNGVYAGLGYSASLSPEREYLLRKGKNNKEILALLIMICYIRDKDGNNIVDNTLEERLKLEPTTDEDTFNKAIIRYNEITADDEHRENTFKRLSKILKEVDIAFIKDNYRLFKEYIKLDVNIN